MEDSKKAKMRLNLAFNEEIEGHAVAYQFLKKIKHSKSDFLASLVCDFLRNNGIVTPESLSDKDAMLLADSIKLNIHKNPISKNTVDMQNANNSNQMLETLLLTLLNNNGMSPNIQLNNAVEQPLMTEISQDVTSSSDEESRRKNEEPVKKESIEKEPMNEEPESKEKEAEINLSLFGNLSQFMQD